MSSIVNDIQLHDLCCARNAGAQCGGLILAISSTTIHALCTPSLHPHCTTKKWYPVPRKTSTARAHAVGVPSCGTMRPLSVT